MSLNKDDTLDSRTSNNTKALIVKQFKGYCRECGEYGHKKANCPKLRKNEKNQRNNKKNPKKNYAKNLTCYYCGKKGHIERDCFKKKRDVEQGIVKPVCKNVEKEEQTETAYGLIATDGNHKTNVCDNCMYEHREVNCKQENNLCLISSSTTNRSIDPQDDKMWIPYISPMTMQECSISRDVTMT